MFVILQIQSDDRSPKSRVAFQKCCRGRKSHVRSGEKAFLFLIFVIRAHCRISVAAFFNISVVWPTQRLSAVFFFALLCRFELAIPHFSLKLFFIYKRSLKNLKSQNSKDNTYVPSMVSENLNRVARQ